MPQKIQNPRVSTALTREFGLVGRVRPALDEVVLPVVLVADLSASTDTPGPRRVASAVFSIAGGAGQFPAFTLAIPANTGIIVKVRRIVCRLTVAGNVEISPGSGFPLAGAGTFRDGQFSDQRYRGQAPQLSGTGDLLPAAYNGGNQRWHLQANVGRELGPLDYTLMYDATSQQTRFMELGSRVDNCTLDGFVEWEEFTSS